MFGQRKEYLGRKKRMERGGKLKAVGKYGKKWLAEKRRQDKVCDRLDYSGCEVRLPGCTFKCDTGQAHSLKRRYTRKDKLWETVRACWNCHQQIEGKPQMESLVVEIRAHRNEEYFICGCLTLITPADLKTHREDYRGVCCDECYLAKEAS
jgi:hypothetical protein